MGLLWVTALYRSIPAGGSQRSRGWYLRIVGEFRSGGDRERRWEEYADVFEEHDAMRAASIVGAVPAVSPRPRGSCRGYRHG